MTKRFVQIQNPKSKVYILVDRDKGTIIGRSNPNRPFHKITIARLKK